MNKGREWDTDRERYMNKGRERDTDRERYMNRGRERDTSCCGINANVIR
jgi:hypothetical protein